MLVSLIICAVIIILDQLTKYFCYGLSQSIIGDFLWFESTLNQGASFGMLQGATVWFVVLSIPVVILMFWVLCSKKYKTSLFFKISVAFVLGGTIGNLIDRIIFGGVRDFIYLKSINFAIFNVADMAITVGVIMIAIYMVIYLCKSTNKKENALAGSEETTSGSTEKLEALKSFRDDLKEKVEPSGDSKTDSTEKTDPKQNKSQDEE